MKNFLQVAQGLDVVPVVHALQLNVDLWNKNSIRKTREASPHVQMDDIWVRYRDDKKFRESGDYSKFNEPHFPIWYPSYKKLPQLRPIIFGLMARMNASMLGGVLITRIPPGGKIEPHSDKGWHPEFYKTKIYVPLQTNPQCWNRVQDEVVTMEPGSAWFFNNLEEHEVQNNGQDDRITLIVCMRVDG